MTSTPAEATLISMDATARAVSPAYHGSEHGSLTISASTGRNQGNQTGIGFRDRLGAGNSMLLQVPGMHTEALPKLIQGRIWNSVFTMVGHMGTSKGRDIDPTLSGGMGGSFKHGRGPGAPAEAKTAHPSTHMPTRITTTDLDTLIVTSGQP